MPSVDPINRSIDFLPTRLPYDPREMLVGRKTEGNAISILPVYF